MKFAAVDAAITPDAELEDNQSLPLKHIEAAKLEPRASTTYFIVQGSKGCLCTSVVIIGTIIFLSIITILFAVPNEPSAVAQFNRGVSVISNYAVDVKVRSRLATTNLTMEVLNAINCSAVHFITVHIPSNARVTSLRTIREDGCIANRQVIGSHEVIDSDREFDYVIGLANDRVDAQDCLPFTVQVFIPPFGTTKLELITEQLFHQQHGEIEFEVPLVPHEEVGTLSFDLSVEDLQGDPADFQIELDLPGLQANATNGASKFHLEFNDAGQYNLPLVVRGRFTSRQIPENGLLYMDGSCFEHYFLPPSSKQIPRNFNFVIDVSSGMKEENRLGKTKLALKKFIDTIGEQDSFLIQTSGETSTRDLWGPSKGTIEKKRDAKKFLDGLNEPDWLNSLDCYEAVLEALLRAKDYIKRSKTHTVSTLVIIANECYYKGKTDRSKIVKDIYELNKDGSVKIFTIGFKNSDRALFDAISLLNGGISKRITSGGKTIEPQMTRFLQGTVGSVLLSDLRMNFTGNQVKVVGETEKYFPLLSGGDEAVVRGLVQGALGNDHLKAEITASTFEGVQNWITVSTDYKDNAKTSSLCYQSYAHARISQLVRLQEAADLIENDVLRSLVTLADANCTEERFVNCIKKEALHLATDAQIVAKGLTVMAVGDDDKCMMDDVYHDVCFDGTPNYVTVWGVEGMCDDPSISASVVSYCSFVAYFVSLVVVLLNL